jgi:hypothetical protein
MVRMHKEIGLIETMTSKLITDFIKRDPQIFLAAGLSVAVDISGCGG